MHSFHTVIAGLLVFGVIVFIHELGHYLAARYCNIQVDVFSIGFGPALFSWHDRVGTRWQLSLLPLGGYVKLYGFEGRASVAEEGAAPEEGNSLDERAYYNQPLASRALVTVMGPVFNVVLTILIFVFLFTFYGRPEIQPDVSTVLAGSAAEKAGLEVGDHLVSLQGHKVLSVSDFQTQIAAHPSETMQLGLLRHGQNMALPVTLDSSTEGGKTIGRLGIGFSITPAKALPFYRAIPDAFVQTWNMCGQIGEGLWQVISGQRSAKQLTGTIGIIHMSGQAAAYGVASLLSFIAMLSLNLGLVNLLPIPMLDGGHLLFYAIEAVRGRPLPEKAQVYALQTGVLFVIIVFLFSSYNDLRGLGLLHWLSISG